MELLSLPLHIYLHRIIYDKVYPFIVTDFKWHFELYNEMLDGWIDLKAPLRAMLLHGPHSYECISDLMFLVLFLSLMS